MSDSCSILEFNKNTKFCKLCKQEFHISKFSKNKAAKDGLQNACKECDSKRIKENRNKRREEFKQYEKDYREKNRNNLTFRLQALLNASRQRALLHGREHTITRDDLFSLFPRDGKCPVFGTDLVWGNSGFRENSPSIDRIDSSKGYTLDNVQIISWRANRIKSYATIEELETVINYMKSGG